MNLKLLIFSVAIALSIGINANAQENFMDELDPRDPNIEAILEAYDSYYESETGKPSHLEVPLFTLTGGSGCFQLSCNFSRS